MVFTSRSEGVEDLSLLRNGQDDELARSGRLDGQRFIFSTTIIDLKGLRGRNEL